MMARMAQGDRAAPFTLYAEFGPAIATAVRRELRELGVERIDTDDLEGLVVESCLALFACAPAWDPDRGALPWTWARRRLRALASAFVGVHHDVLDCEGQDGGVGDDSHWPPVVGVEPEPEELEVLARLARHDGTVGLLAEALQHVTTARNRTIVLDVKVQAALGDPSPAATVGALHGLRAEAVRQIVKRTLDRLRTLASAEPRFAPLADLALLS